MKNAKSRPKTRLDKVIMLLINNSWQGFVFAKITFGEELAGIDVQEIRGLLDKDGDFNSYKGMLDTKRSDRGKNV